VNAAPTPAEDAKANSDKVPDAYAISGQFERVLVLRFKYQTDLLAGTLVDPSRLAAFDDTAIGWSGALRNVALINHAAGEVRSLDWVARIEALPTCVALVHGLEPGARLRATTDLIDSPGYVYLAADNSEDVERDYLRLRQLESAGLYVN